MRTLAFVGTSLASLVLTPTLASAAGCPYANPAGFLHHRQEDDSGPDPGAVSPDIVAAYEVDDGEGTTMTSDVGSNFADQDSLRAGDRGPTLLEDFIFRQKITHFDHERVPERAVHARGAGAFGTFTSYADWSNITAASFLAQDGKQTPMFVRFSTVVGSRGSADTARDVHGFATRFYTDAGNFDLVGNNIPVFFIQDAIQFPDLIHSVKPRADSEFPQAATAHDEAWDFFSQQTSTMHTLFWAMSGHGIPRSFRHMDGFAVNTYRLVTDNGDSRLVKWHWKTLQGRASLLWEEAQQVAGKNGDFHRQDLWDAIEAGEGPEWELAVQIIAEEDALAFGFDLLDATKILPEEYVPLTKLGKMKLEMNPTNYFAETEQIMFQPGHVVRGVDFTEDPLLQGRIFSYLDTQINRHGGPNFEQLPINRPVVPVHNNNRDGAGQMFIHRNKAPYTPNTLNRGFPSQANQTVGNGFFTAPDRGTLAGPLVRARPSTFADHFSQPRLFFNSLTREEQQMVVNAIRFETAHLTSDTVKSNVISTLNRISNEVASRVASAIGLDAPAPDPTFYHDNTTADVGTFGNRLPSIRTLRVGVVASVNDADGMSQAADLTSRLMDLGLQVLVVAERLADGVNVTFASADATSFDATIAVAGAEKIVDPAATSPLYPAGRPAQILVDSFRFGKAVGFLGNAGDAISSLQGVVVGDGVYVESDAGTLVREIANGLATWRFLGRMAMDDE